MNKKQRKTRLKKFRDQKTMGKLAKKLKKKITIQALLLPKLTQQERQTPVHCHDCLWCYQFKTKVICLNARSYYYAQPVKAICPNHLLLPGRSYHSEE